MQEVAITGGYGFIGRHFINLLGKRPDIQLRIFVHRNHNRDQFKSTNIVTVVGDLLQPETINELLTPDCTLINLAYLTTQSRQDNLVAMKNLADACAKNHIKRVVHCSTAVVVGDVLDDEIDEVTHCSPQSDYEINKFEIEQLLIEKSKNSFELGILRPTAVFGPGGKNLLKLAHDICHGNRVINYLKSCLYGHRRMNLVHVDNVASALALLTFRQPPLNREIFLISDDENPKNNYRDIEKYLTASFNHQDFLLPRIPVPPAALSCCLKVAGKPSSNPHRIFRSSKIKSYGFQKSVSFETGLQSFADWYQKQSL